MGLKLSKKGRRHRSYSFSEKDKPVKPGDAATAEGANDADNKKGKKSKRSFSSAAKFSLKKEKSNKVSGHIHASHNHLLR